MLLANRKPKELGVQMIPAYSPQARGRSERSFGTWPKAVAAGVALGRYQQPGGKQSVPFMSGIAEFKGKITVTAKEKGTAFRKTSRSDLDWLFTIQTACSVER